MEHKLRHDIAKVLQLVGKLNEADDITTVVVLYVSKTHGLQITTVGGQAADMIVACEKCKQMYMDRIFNQPPVMEGQTN